MAGYSGGWRSNRGTLTYAARRPFRMPINPVDHGPNGTVQANALGRITGPERTGPGEPGLIDEQTPYATDSARGWRGDRTPQDKRDGFVGQGGQDALEAHREAYAYHAQDLGAVEDVITEKPAMFQLDRTVGWRYERFKPLGHGSQAALGRGLNGLEMNNDPAAQHYAWNWVGAGRVDRKFPSRRIWTRYLTPLRMRVAAQAVVSQRSEVSPATSWFPTLTPGRSGKSTQPMLRRSPRDWTEDRTVDDSASAIAESAEPSWGL